MQSSKQTIQDLHKRGLFDSVILVRRFISERQEILHNWLDKSNYYTFRQ
jgi:hypothetical protein